MQPNHNRAITEHNRTLTKWLTITQNTHYNSATDKRK